MVAHLAVILLGRNDYMKLNTASSSSVSLSDDRPFSVDCIFFFMGVSSNTTDQTHTRPSSLHTTLLLHYRIGSTMYMHSSAHTLSLTTVHTTCMVHVPQTHRPETHTRVIISALVVPCGHSLQSLYNEDTIVVNIFYGSLAVSPQQACG